VEMRPLIGPQRHLSLESAGVGACQKAGRALAAPAWRPHARPTRSDHTHRPEVALLEAGRWSFGGSQCGRKCGGRRRVCGSSEAEVPRLIPRSVFVVAVWTWACRRLSADGSCAVWPDCAQIIRIVFLFPAGSPTLRCGGRKFAPANNLAKERNCFFPPGRVVADFFPFSVSPFAFR